jgi:hypothetical protein
MAFKASEATLSLGLLWSFFHKNSHQLYIISFSISSHKFVMEISDKFSENEWINILAKLVEKEPITKAKLSADSFNLAWFFGQP